MIWLLHRLRYIQINRNNLAATVMSSSSTNQRLPNLVGQRFGWLLVLELGPRRGSSRTWICRCDCGGQSCVTTSNLRAGTTASCGCGQRRFMDLAGRQYGRLTVVAAETTRSINRYRTWVCRCSCGNEKVVTSGDLQSGHVRSCGCLVNETGEQSKRWGGCGEISGKYWSGTKRSANKRGFEFSVTIKEAWDLFGQQQGRCALSGVTLQFGKEQDASLDRKDSSRGYTPDNVQWVHKWVNLMKTDLSEAEFIDWCRKVVSYTG